MRTPSHASRGFTLIELIAVITIIAIIAAVGLSRLPAASPFADRGYADAVAAHLRRARAVALTTGCDVQFTIDNTGYRARQRAAAGTHCASGGPFVTAVFQGPEPSEVILAAGRTLVFEGQRGTVVTAPVNIDIGSRRVIIDTSGLVTGP
jgi:prepilin-type N-terminal cleavage/methylation domain-containing protein